MTYLTAYVVCYNFYTGDFLRDFFCKASNKAEAEAMCADAYKGARVLSTFETYVI